MFLSFIQKFHIERGFLNFFLYISVPLTYDDPLLYYTFVLLFIFDHTDFRTNLFALFMLTKHRDVRKNVYCVNKIDKFVITELWCLLIKLRQVEISK